MATDRAAAEQPHAEDVCWSRHRTGVDHLPGFELDGSNLIVTELDPDGPSAILSKDFNAV